MRQLSLQKSRLEGRYDIQNHLAQGSYAEIFVARDTLASPQSPHSTVVIKALNVFLQNDLDTDLERTLVENFQNEAIALDRVRHPNIISRLGHGTARDLHGTVFHYLVLEYLSGGDLAKSCREKSLPLKKALNYLEQVCAGLGHAHRHGIIHRDIKPQNLLLTEDRVTVKIADFGVARVSQTDSPITRVGTNIFAPPEHSPMLADDENALVYKELTPAADIYSLAKSAYVLITCESPRIFANHPITELPFAVRQKDWAEELLKILKRATQSNPSERHQTVNEFWQDLAKLAQYRDAEDGEHFPVLNVKTDKIPQAHVARGYTPIAPQKPRFNTSRDLKIKNLPLANNAPLVVQINGDELLNKYNRTINEPLEKTPKPPPAPFEEKNEPPILSVPPLRKNNFLRRVFVFLLAISIFAGVLYGTHTYLSGRGILPKFGNPFAKQTGTANTDLNLRPEPNTSKDPIGFVSKNSRVRVLSSQNNWYEIEIIQQGHTLETPNSTDRGWINGKYLDLD